MPGIYVELVDEKIHLTGWVGPETPDLCKAVGSGRFHKQTAFHKAFWAYPCEVRICYRLREVFGTALQIGPELNAWARVAIAEQKARIELGTKLDANLEHVAHMAPVADQAMSNRTYQRVAVKFGAQAGSWLLTDEQGLGKTIELLCSLLEATPDPFDVKYHLIFAPKTAVNVVWAPEIRQWLGDIAEVHSITGNRAERDLKLRTVPDVGHVGIARHVFVICNLEMARIKSHINDKGKKAYKVEDAEYPQLFDRVWDTIIVDESQRALIRTSGTPTQIRAGFTHLKSINRIAASGTPMRGKPEQLWGTLNWLRPDLFSSYWNWVSLYFELKSNGFSNYVIGGLLPGAAERMQSDLAFMVLRRTKAEVLPELPPKFYPGTYLLPDAWEKQKDGTLVNHSPHGIWLEMSDAHRKQYEKFCEDASLDFDDGSTLMAVGVLPEYTRKRQLANAKHIMVGGKLTPTLDSPKYEWILQKCADMGIASGEGEGKLVVGSHSTSLLNVFAEGLRNTGIAVHLLTGKTTDKRRVEMKDDFQSENSSARVFMLNVKAGGVAITLDAADDVIRIDESTIPDDDIQFEDRVHRTSRIHQVNVHCLRTLDTQDEEIAWVAAARDDVQRYLQDGTRGVAFAKARFIESRAAATN